MSTRRGGEKCLRRRGNSSNLELLSTPKHNESSNEVRMREIMLMCVHSRKARFEIVRVVEEFVLERIPALVDSSNYHSLTEESKMNSSSEVRRLIKLRFINLLIMKQFPPARTKNDNNKILIINVDSLLHRLRPLDMNIIFCCVCCQISVHYVFFRHCVVVGDKLANSLCCLVHCMKKFHGCHGVSS